MKGTSGAGADYDGVERTGFDAVFPGTGEMTERCRTFEWSTTPLGPVSAWSQSLKTLVGTLLGSRNPMFLFWGPEHVQIYNDAYRPSFGDGGRHPGALGMRAEDCWTDIWSAIAPQIEQVMTTGEATWHEDQYLPIERNGRLEDVWWTYSYGPAFDDDGSIGGVLVVCQETTSRIRAEQRRDRMAVQTERAERSAARVLAQMSDEHLTMDHEFRIQTVNPAAERALGRRSEELIGLTHWEAFPASVGTPVEEHYHRVIRDRVEAHFTHHYVGEGHDRFLEIDAYPLDDGGAALFWREVTARYRAEIALQESEAKYRSLFESMDQGFCVIEVCFDAADRPVDYRFLETNPAFVRHTGLENAVGRLVREMVPNHEDHWFERYGRVALTGEVVRFEDRADALGRWYDVFAFRLMPPEKRQVAVLFEDITQVKEATAERERLVRALELERERLAEVFRVAPSFLAVLRGPEHTFEQVNEAYYRVVGRRDLIGKPLLEALPEMRDQPFPALLDSVLATGEPYVGREARIQLARIPGRPPEERYVNFIYQPLVEADGRRSGVVAHGSDVTEQVMARRDIERLLAESERARAEAETARAEAEGANRAKSEFLAVMSHELRTPLNAIGGYAELMEMGIRGPVTPQQRGDLVRIQTSQRHLLGLINEVLNYAKLETGSVHYALSSVPVQEALAGAVSLVQPQASGKGLSLRVRKAAPALAIRADAEKLRQILVNLLSNAVKFTDAGGAVTMSASSRGPSVSIRIKDTGIGIPADKLEAVFDPFVQVRADLSRPHEGTGLGLAISRDLARGMGGDLTAVSVAGKGSTFTLVLPCADAPAGSEAPQ